MKTYAFCDGVSQDKTIVTLTKIGPNLEMGLHAMCENIDHVDHVHYGTKMEMDRLPNMI